MTLPLTTYIDKVTHNFVRQACLVLVVALGAGFPLDPAHAGNNVVVSGTAEATSSIGPSIAIGDSFTFSYTLNLDSTATGGSTFNNAVTSFSLTAHPANVGTWSTSGINWVITPVKNLVTNQNGDQLTLQVQALNAPQINGVNFFDLGITIDWAPAVVDIQPVSGTPSLGTTLGTFSPDLQTANYYFELRDANFSSESFTATATPVSGGADSSGSTSNASALQSFELSFNTSGGLNCDTPSARGTYSSWIQLPTEEACVSPIDRTGSSLLGWSTSADFPVNVAREQLAKGWGTIDSEFNGRRMIFIPAGGYVYMSGDNNLHAIWG